MGESQNDMEKLFGESKDDGRREAEAQAMIRQQTTGGHAYKYLIETSDKTQLMELLMRTYFISREEMIAFIEYVSWCEDFNEPLDNARRYAASRPSVGGMARTQLVEALNTFRWMEPSHKKGLTQKDDKSLPG